MSEWQPIETAPKDGGRFLACQDGELYVAHYTTNDKPPRRKVTEEVALRSAKINHNADYLIEVVDREVVTLHTSAKAYMAIDFLRRAALSTTPARRRT